MVPKIGQDDEIGDKLVRISKADPKLAMYEHKSRGGGFSVYLYESRDWELDDSWLLKAYRNTKTAADELFAKIEKVL